MKRKVISDWTPCLGELVVMHTPNDAALKYYRHHVTRTIVHSGSQCCSMLLSVTVEVRAHKPHVRLAAHVLREILVGVCFASMNEEPFSFIGRCGSESDGK